MPFRTESNSNNISEIFKAVQYNKTCHQKYLKKLRKYYDKMNLDVFTEDFISNLRVPMTYIEKHLHVENTLIFAAKFAISLQPQCENEEEYEDMCPFLEKIFEFLLTHHDAKEIGIRFRVCYFFNLVLDTMGDNATIDDELCNKISECMMERLSDKSPKVRAQAATALYRLQEPNNKGCPVIKLYLLHLAKDPSAEVRRVILAKMAKNQMTLEAALKRTRDVDDAVRKMAYLFISKITVKSLKIFQREQLVNNGLQDRSELVKNCVKEILIPSWLRYYDKNFIAFIKAIDAENAAKTATLAMNCLFKSVEIELLIKQLPIDDTKFIPVDQLSSESVLYWRCLAEFFKTDNFTDEFDQIMPELSPLCAYIKDFIALMSSNSYKQYERISQQFILQQLFEMVKLHDLSDEMGRCNLKDLFVDTLQNYECPEKLSECIVKYFKQVVPDVNCRVNMLVEVINEIRFPSKENVLTQKVLSEDEQFERKMQRAKLGIQLLELEDEEYTAIQRKDFAKAQEVSHKVSELKVQIENLSKESTEITETQKDCEPKNDPETMIQCLQIMYYMMQSSSINSLSPTLRTLMDSVALPFIDLQNNHHKVLTLALKCVGLCCLVNKELAKKYFMIYLLHITESTSEEIWIASTEIIFDFLLKYGVEYFDNDNEDTHVNDRIATVDISSNIIKILMELLQSQVQNLQSVAAEGLCKLILHKRISSHQLISQLLILWHNPASNENPFLIQCLCNFFKLYISKVSESQTILLEAYLPTLKLLANAPEMSPLLEIDSLRVSEVIISLTCCAIHNNYSIHNQLTYLILSEILNPETEIVLNVLIKSLKMLDVQLDGEDLKNNILKALEDIDTLLNGSGEKRLLTHIQQFRAKITAPRNNDLTQNENGENGEAAENQEENENAENGEEQGGENEDD